MTQKEAIEILTWYKKSWKNLISTPKYSSSHLIDAVELAIQALEEKQQPEMRIRFYPKDTDETYDGTLIEETQYAYFVAPDDNLTGTARWSKKYCEIIK